MPVEAPSNGLLSSDVSDQTVAHRLKPRVRARAAACGSHEESLNRDQEGAAATIPPFAKNTKGGLSDGLA
ncbi:hypothetical protein C1J03_10395 [Sulfitobacter sp. SK012]|nr:hypothetical protein C1J03_10395 [Sulfitobacter sp. SK012]